MYAPGDVGLQVSKSELDSSIMFAPLVLAGTTNVLSEGNACEARSIVHNPLEALAESFMVPRRL